TATGTTTVTVTAEPEVPVENTAVIIYEAYGGGGNSGAYYRYDYIILYNTTDAAIDLSTYSVQYTSATGTTWSKTDLTGSIAAHSYYVIQEASGSNTAAANLPVTPDCIGSIAMGSSGFKLALVSSQTVITGTGIDDPSVVDYLGCGSATTFEGTAAAAAPSNTTSVKRVSFIDNDENSTDFAAGAIDLSYLTA
ncbi:MAG TPA: lamin tail domain-containing protein, partial [Flexilinea sp.]|nr:lamin tail domain-containing protein [Flexilinea sp.]